VTLSELVGLELLNVGDSDFLARGIKGQEAVAAAHLGAEEIKLGFGVAVKIADAGGFFEPCHKRSMKSDAEVKFTPKRPKSNPLKKVRKLGETPLKASFLPKPKVVHPSGVEPETC